MKILLSLLPLMALCCSFCQEILGQEEIGENHRACIDSVFWINRIGDTIPLPTSHNRLTTGWIPFPYFTDEFNSDSIPQDVDRSKWKVYDQICHTMSTLAYFKDTISNVFCMNGMLNLKTNYDVPYTCTFPKEMKDWTLFYSSGFIRTLYKVQYGYFETRCKAPTILELEPCFWIEGARRDGDRIIEQNEMDINEVDRFHANSTHFGHGILQTLHYYINNDTIKNTTGISRPVNFESDYLGEWLILGVEWFPNEINMYLNGKIIAAYKYTTDHNVIDLRDTTSGWNISSSEFTCVDFFEAIPMNILFSLSVRNKTNNFDSPYAVDYIRTFKLKKGLSYFWPDTFIFSDTNMFRVHDDIKLGGDANHTAVISSGLNVTFWATKSIVMDKGFVVNPATQFTARIIREAPQLYNVTTPINEPNPDLY